MWHRALSCIKIPWWLIAVLKLGPTLFFNMSLHTVALILLCSLTRGPVLDRNHAKHHHTSSSRFIAAFNALRRISFLRTASNEPSSITTEQVKLWLVAEISTTPLFFSPDDVFSGKFQSAYYVLFINVRHRRSYLTVQIRFIKFSGNSLPWYFNVKISIRSFRDSGCYRKSILFLFITNPSVFRCSGFPRPAM